MATADPTVKAVLNHLLQNGGGNYKVIEEWHEGTEWYRVWSSGLIEQAGTYPSAGTPKISLRKPFSNVDYIIVMSGGCGSIKKETTTVSFDATFGMGIKTEGLWYALGY